MKFVSIVLYIAYVSATPTTGHLKHNGDKNVQSRSGDYASQSSSDQGRNGGMVNGNSQLVNGGSNGKGSETGHIHGGHGKGQESKSEGGKSAPKAEDSQTKKTESKSEVKGISSTNDYGQGSPSESSAGNPPADRPVTSTSGSPLPGNPSVSAPSAQGHPANGTHSHSTPAHSTPSNSSPASTQTASHLSDIPSSGGSPVGTQSGKVASEAEGVKASHQPAVEITTDINAPLCDAVIPKGGNHTVLSGNGTTEMTKPKAQKNEEEQGAYSVSGASSLATTIVSGVATAFVMFA